MQTSEVMDRVYRVLHDELDIEGITITPNMHLMNDLGADSLGSVEIVMAMEEEFNITIPDEKIDQIVFVEDIVKTVGELIG